MALVERNWLIGYRIAEEELRAEIENQKTIFNLQHEKDNNEKNK